jgi:hypothetical protein
MKNLAADVIIDAVERMPAEKLRAVLLAHLNPEAVKAILLDAVKERLGNTTAPKRAKPLRKADKASRVPAKPRATSARAKGEKRSAGDLESMGRHIAEVLSSNPGLTAEGLAVATGFSTKEMALPIRKLLNAGTIRTTGQKRATRYYPADAAPTASEPKRRHPRIHVVPREEVIDPVEITPREVVLDNAEQAAE